nr:Tetratricopeptide-like helical [Ipomoea batatas]GMC59604.1 Tetratricopeptide-like helical [Ipomoea batatas]GMC62341.1 Tetratricopeptide-like helical [Ipomoea batatas]GMC67482.1 Tetratricopeptide-like helical [Ipomoea batatas]GME01198.1 Tetratricopeptide-like helical [Ipomoea batatas]
MSSSVSIEALAMAGADYVECNLQYESALPPPHLLADDDKEEFLGKLHILKRSIPAMISHHQSKNVHNQSENNRADHVLNEYDFI